MSQDFFRLEKGISIEGENSDVGVKILFGSAAPGGDAGPQDAAEQGSFYLRTNGEAYYKKTAGAGADKWVRSANLDDILALSWRSEIVRAATSEDLAAGVRNLTTTPFTDDDGTQLTAADFVVGQYVLGDVLGTPQLFEVTDVSAPNITLTEETENPLANNDVFSVRAYLPDSPDDQEQQAILLYNGSTMVKLGDFNWDLATGINISAGFTKQNGTVTNGDTVESAIEKLAGNQEDLTTLSGSAQGAVNHGSFTGESIADNRTTREALQDLETALEAKKVETAITAIRTLDEVAVDDLQAVKWLVCAKLDSNKALTAFAEINAVHDGHSGADATDTDHNTVNKLKLGAAFAVTYSVDLQGTGVSQTMRLRATAPSAVSIVVKRVPVYAQGV